VSWFGAAVLGMFYPQQWKRKKEKKSFSRGINENEDDRGNFSFVKCLSHTGSHIWTAAL
jgi:hypothetical protein